MKDARYKDTPLKKDSPASSNFKTPDLYLSAFLKTKGIVLQGINEKNGKVFFIFQNDGNIQDLINQYFNDSDVGVLSYKAALSELRSIIFNYQNLKKYYQR